MQTDSVTSYDELPYHSNPFHYTHPDALATAAILAGLEAPDVQRCRVLELGCAGGGNLIPMAEGLPESNFVGIDLSARQVAQGQAIIDALKLQNIQLEAMSILDVTPKFGQFDYIICHGVYSWVPPAVQEKILEICNVNLSRNGVAYVSYNTYPGWHMRQMIREMMLFHVEQVRDPRQRVREALTLLDMLVHSAGNHDTPYAQLLKDEMETLQSAGEHYVFHEHLEDINEPLYFHQFVKRAAAKGLQYLGEAQSYEGAGRIDPSAAQWLMQQTNDAVRREQYCDFIMSRRFRWTLLCHDDQPVDHTPDPRRVEKLQIAAILNCSTPDPDLRSDAKVTFVSPKNVELTSDNPIVKGALAALIRHKPAAISFDTLCQEIQRMARGTDEPMSDADRQFAAGAVLQCHHSGTVELHTYLPPFTLKVGERPKAMLMARLQAADQALITSRRHRIIHLNPFDFQVLMLLDGTRDRAALLTAIEAAVASGELGIKDKEGNASDPSVLPDLLDHSLRRIAFAALLVE